VIDFERTLDTLRIVWIEPPRRLRIDTRQSGVHRGPAVFLGHGVDHQADHRIGFGQLIQSFDERFEIQHGSAHEQGDVAALADFAHHHERIVAKTCRRVVFVRLDEVDQMMWNRTQRFLIGFCSADVHPFVDERGIDTHDF